MSYQPPSRKNLEELLAVAKRRVKLPGAGWTDGLASTALIRDLIQKKFLDQTVPVALDRAGLGRTLNPRSYHWLLRILGLKARGNKRRQAWRVHLWLHRREFRFDAVRKAFVSEFERLLSIVRSDLAPTGRFTEPFPVKFQKSLRRSMERNPKGTLMPELDEIMGIIAPLMARPSSVSELDPDIEKIVGQVVDVFPGLVRQPGGSDDLPTRGELISALRSGVETVKRLEPPPEYADRALRATGEAMLMDMAGGNVTSARQIGALVSEGMQRLPGMIDDQYGRSRLLETLKTASEEHYCRARAILENIWSGRLELEIRKILSTVSADETPLLEYVLLQSRFQRQLTVCNPDFRIQIFAIWLDDIAKTPVKVNYEKPPDWREVLRMRIEEARRAQPSASASDGEGAV